MPRKPQSADTTVVLTPEEARRMEWEEFQAQDQEYQKTAPAVCPECGARAGYNPITGIQVRSHHNRHVIDGHRDSCSQNMIGKSRLNAR